MISLSHYKIARKTRFMDSKLTEADTTRVVRVGALLTPIKVERVGGVTEVLSTKLAIAQSIQSALD